MKRILFAVFFTMLFASQAIYADSFSAKVEDVHFTLISVKKKGKLELTFIGVNQGQKEKKLVAYSYGSKISGANGKKYKYYGYSGGKTFPVGVPLKFKVTFERNARELEKISTLKLDFRGSDENLVLKNIPVPFSQKFSLTDSYNKKAIISSTVNEVDFHLISVKQKRLLELTFIGINKGEKEKDLNAYSYGCTIIGANGVEYKYYGYPVGRTFPVGVPLKFKVTFEKDASKLKQISYLKVDFRSISDNLIMKNIPVPFSKELSLIKYQQMKPSFSFYAGDVKMTLERVAPKRRYLVLYFKAVNEGDREFEAGGWKVEAIDEKGNYYRYPRMITWRHTKFPPNTQVDFAFPIEKAAAKAKKLVYVKFHFLGQEIILHNIPTSYGKTPKRKVYKKRRRRRRRRR